MPFLHRREVRYADTPKGIFTASGVWFRATEASLHDYAAPVLTHEPLPMLLARAERWLRSAQTITLWAVPLLLALVPPVPACLAAVTLYVGWRALSPAFTSLGADGVLRLLDPVFGQGLYYVFMLSLFAAREQFVLVWTGLAVFIILRWGILERIVQPVVRRLWASLFDLPVADQVLRGFIIRAALKYGEQLPQLERLEKQILEQTSHLRK